MKLYKGSQQLFNLLWNMYHKTCCMLHLLFLCYILCYDMFYWSFLGFMKHLDAVLKNAVILKSKHGFLNFGKKWQNFTVTI